jgi:hypothetical protein
MRNLSLFALSVSVLLLLSCQNNSNQLPVSDQVLTNGAIPEDFHSFYEKFHSDSQFQLTHISWPLSGKTGIQKDSNSTDTVDKIWEKENWRMHKLDAFDPKDYKREWEAVGDILVMERITARAVPFGIERRFAKRPDKEWELIFYSDTHEFK